MRVGYIMQDGVPDIRRGPFGGPAVHVRQVVRSLQALGHRVRTVARLDGRIWLSEDLQGFLPVEVRLADRGPLRWLERLVRRVQSDLHLPYAGLCESLRFALACRQLLHGCDLLYERAGWMGYGGGLAARWLRIPLVMEVNGDFLAELESRGIAPRGIQRALSVHLMRRAFGRAARLVATGNGWRSVYVDAWGVDPARISVVENGSEIVDLLPRERLRAFQRPPHDDHSTRLVHVGAFEPWHDLSLLLRAAATVIRTGVDLRVLLIGAGPELDRTRQIARDLRIDARVEFTGHLAILDVAAHLASADLAASVYRGRTEFSGLKLLDYKGAGLATIASGTGGQPSVLHHGRTGWIVPPGNEEALEEGLATLAGNAELRREMGRKARIEAEAQHTWRHTALHLVEIFQKTIEQDDHAPASHPR